MYTQPDFSPSHFGKWTRRSLPQAKYRTPQTGLQQQCLNEDVFIVHYYNTHTQTTLRKISHSHNDNAELNQHGQMFRDARCHCYNVGGGVI